MWPGSLVIEVPPADTVKLESDPQLFRGVQTIVAAEGGRVVGRAHISPSGESTLRVPLLPGPGRRCSVRFSVAHTLVPALGGRPLPDLQVLGAHFLY